MKIVRFCTKKGVILYGVVEGEDAAAARIIEGDIFEDFVVTDHVEIIETLLAPLAPQNIFALGFNYRKHAEEADAQYPEIPEVFMKATTSVTGSGTNIVMPKAGAHEVDYEGELALIIGKEAKNVEPEEADRYILGYSCANDVSARDWQWKKQRTQWVRAKSFDTFCPLGPCIVTKEEIKNPRALGIRTLVNGATMQESNTSHMIFDIYEIVSNLSQSVTLRPGTVILTGTPEGVGFTRTPPVYLSEGDEITVSIEGVGTLINTVIKEQ